MSYLSGEYVYDGQLHSTDSDIDVVGHEGFFLQEIAHLLRDDVVTLATQALSANEESENTKILREYLNNLYNDDEIDYNDVLNTILYIGEVDPDIYNSLLNKYGSEIEVINYKPNKRSVTDPRVWGVEHGYILSRNNSFELYDFNKNKSKLLDMIYEILEANGVDDDEPVDDEIDIFDYKTNRGWSTTIGELQSGDQGIGQSNPIITSKSNYYIPINRNQMSSESHSKNNINWSIMMDSDKSFNRQLNSIFESIYAKSQTYKVPYHHEIMDRYEVTFAVEYTVHGMYSPDMPQSAIDRRQQQPDEGQPELEILGMSVHTIQDLKSGQQLDPRKNAFVFNWVENTVAPKVLEREEEKIKQECAEQFGKYWANEQEENAVAAERKYESDNELSFPDDFDSDINDDMELSSTPL